MTSTQRWTLAVVCAATAMLMLDIAVVNTALSAIAADLDTGLSGLQWVVDAYTLPLAATVITAGALADRFGRRRLFCVGLGVFTATSLLCAAAQSITMLNAARAAQGVGAAMMFAVSLAVLSNAFPRMEDRVKALAAYGATMGGSFAVGPLVGGALTSGLDWRWIFLINLPLGLLCLWIVRRFVAESMDPRAPRVDRPGVITLTGGLFAARLRAAARERGGMGERDDRRLLRRRRRAAVRVRRHRGARRAADAPAAPVPQPVVHRRAGRGVRDLRVAVRDVALHDAVPAADPGAVGDRGGPRVRAGNAAQLLRRGRHGVGRPEGLPARAGRDRPGADRRRPGAADDRRRWTRRGGCSSPACSSRWSARGCSTRRSARSR